MNNELTVECSIGTEKTGVITGIINTLPKSFVLDPASAADVKVIDGAECWAEEALRTISSGTKGLVILSPGPTKSDSLDGLFELCCQRSISTVIAYPALGVNKLGEGSNSFTIHSSQPVCRESFYFYDSDLDASAAMLRHLELVLPYSGEFYTLNKVSVNKTGYSCQINIHGGNQYTPMTLTGTYTTSKRMVFLRSKYVSRDSSVDVESFLGIRGKPSQVMVSDHNGVRRLPLRYEDPLRSAFRKSHDDITTGKPDQNHLRNFIKSHSLVYC